ncbi:MAG: aldo/keto reductase, partial [Rhodospirillales bacterium]|nr:aldo/keto reductase [Rhodospirillales bacterium]
PQYNMFERSRVETEYLPLYSEIGLGTTIWSPLYSGLLTGKYNDGIPTGSRITVDNYRWLTDRVTGDKQKIEKVRQLGKLAGEIGTNITMMAIAWCLKNPHVSTVILGASKIEQLEQNLKAIEVIGMLTPEVMDQIDRILDTPRS